MNEEMPWWEKILKGGLPAVLDLPRDRPTNGVIRPVYMSGADRPERVPEVEDAQATVSSGRAMGGVPAVWLMGGALVLLSLVMMGKR